MRSYEFYQLDVFTDKPFSGNPLAVFPDVSDLSQEEMQHIAREMNLSETVFVYSSDKALKRLRIFTPSQELPMAGHPVVGTWNLLARLGVTPKPKNYQVTIEQELNIGVLPVDIEFEDDLPSKVTMTQGKFEPGAIVSGEEKIALLAKALGLEIEDLAVSDYLPIQVVSTGIKSLAVPVASLDALSRCRINSSLLSEIYLAYGAIGCYAFTLETIEKDKSRAHTRFFAPDDGIAEDPATGSAAGALSAYLVYHGAVETNSFTIEQGDFMKRPSRIHVDITGNKGNIEKVRVGGQSVVVAKGEVFFD